MCQVIESSAIHCNRAMKKTYFSTVFALTLGLGVFSCKDPGAGLTVFEETTELKDMVEASDSRGNVYRAGIDQVSANNQDAYVEKRDREGNLLWSMHHSATRVDERAILVSVDPFDIPWVVFTVDGGSTDDAYITKKHVSDDDAWGNALFKGYGRAGGAAKVSVITCLNPEHGRVERGTFLMARTQEGNVDAVDKTNTLLITSLMLDNTRVNVRTKSWFMPPGVGANHKNFTFHPEATPENKTDNHWVVDYSFWRGLNQVVEAEIVK